MATEGPAPPSDRVALVTGAGRGIGKATALALAGQGFAVALAARTEGDLATVAGEITAAGGRSLVVPADVADEGSVAGLVARVLATHGRLDVLVNAAGTGAFTPVAETSLAEWERQLRVNLTGTFLACRAALPPMLAAGRGDIVNVLSIASRVVFPGAAAYCASKWGALGFTRVLAEEVRRQGIRVTALCPGSVDTPFWDAIPSPPDRARMLAPEAVADTICWIVTRPPTMTMDEIVVMPPEGIL
jgi:NAD(P)-dependent dehydrogenase (short-subunit alcohol dehydrogenase family)